MAKKTKAPAEATPEQPYYLQRAHIKDFRSIRNAKAEFKPGLNIIIGPNGAGKTNFILALEHGMRKSLPDFRGELELVLQGRNQIEVAYEDRDTLRNEALQSQSVELTGKRQQSIRFSMGEKTIEAENFAQAQLQIMPLVQLLNGDGMLFLSGLVVVRHGTPFPYALVNTPEEFSVYSRGVGLNIDEYLFFPQSFGSGIATALLAIHAKAGRANLPTHEEITNALEKVEHFFLERIGPQLKKFTPIEDIRLTAAYHIYTNSTQQQVVVRGVVFEFKTNGDWLPFDALSSGTQRLIYIVSELVGSFLTYPASKARQLHQTDKIILLEEPELGIHPDQLHLLLSFLREQSEKHQLIITTHSPQVLDMLHEDELDRITICELDEKKGTQFRKLNAKSIATAKRYMNEVGDLSDYWRYGSLEEKI